MSQKEFLTGLLKKLEDPGISYMISGSLGSSFHGEPRATNDVDIVITCTPEQLTTFIQSLDENYYVSPDYAKEALARQTMFNVIDYATGWKADLIIRKDRPFSREEFSRRIPANLLGIDVFVVSPEDQILSKLEWSKKGRSERQFNDALGVAVVQWPNLDQDYLRTWAKALEVEDLLDQLIENAKTLVDKSD